MDDEIREEREHQIHMLQSFMDAAAYLDVASDMVTKVKNTIGSDAEAVWYRVDGLQMDLTRCYWDIRFMKQHIAREMGFPFETDDEADDEVVKWRQQRLRDCTHIEAYPNYPRGTPHYYLKASWQADYQEVTAEQYMKAEQAAGYLSHRNNEPALGAFDNHGISGYIKFMRGSQ